MFTSAEMRGDTVVLMRRRHAIGLGDQVEHVAT